MAENASLCGVRGQHCPIQSNVHDFPAVENLGAKLHFDNTSKERARPSSSRSENIIGKRTLKCIGTNTRWGIGEDELLHIDSSTSLVCATTSFVKPVRLVQHG